MTQWKMHRKFVGTLWTLKRANRLSFAAISALTGLATAQSSHAASATWTGGSGIDSNWSTAGNWSPAAAPGDFSFTNTDVATFSGTPTVITPNLDQNYSIGSIIFGNGTVTGDFTLSASAGKSLFLSGASSTPTSITGAGIIADTEASPTSGTAHYDTISAPIVLENTSGTAAGNGSYFFMANGGSSAAGISSFLSITGSVTGSASSGNVSTLEIGGSNNTRSLATPNQISGVISDGANGGQLGLTFNYANGVLGTTGSTTWILGGSNTYSGGTNIICGSYQGRVEALTNTAFGTGLITWGAANNLMEFGTAGLNIANNETSGGALGNQTGYFDSSLNGATISGTLSGNSYQVLGGKTITFSGSNNYTGTTTVSGATTLVMANASALGTNAAVNLATSGATLDLHGYNASTGLVTSVAGATLTNSVAAPVTLTITASSGTGTAAGTFNQGAGTLSIVKYGNGSTQSFNSTANVFSGGLTVYGGTVQTSQGGNSSLIFGTGAITLASTGASSVVTNKTLYNGSNSNTWNNNIVVAGGTINRIENSANGTNSYTGSLTGSGTLVLSVGFNPNVQLNGDMTNFSGTLDLAGNGGTSSYSGFYDLANAATAGVPNGSIQLTPALLSTNVGNAAVLRWNPATAASATIPIGSLSTGTFGGAQGGNNAILDNVAAGATATFQVGGLNTSNTFAGVITNGPGTGIVAINKVGSGSWTVGTTLNANTTITTNSGSTAATVASNNNGLQIGESITGSGIALGTTIAGVSGTSITLSTAATSSVSGSAFAVQNNYTGTTNVSGGTLILNGLHGNGTTGNYLVGNGATLKVTGSGSLTGSATVAINGGATLISTGTTGSIAGPLSIAGGTTSSTIGTINMADGQIGTLSLGGGLTVGDVSGSNSVIDLDASSTSDLLSLGSSVFTENAGGAAINISNGGITAGHTYTLISYASGAGAGFATGTGTTVGGLTLTDPSLGFGVSGTLNVSNTAVTLVTTGASSPASAYWAGNMGSLWTSNTGGNGNFTTAFDGSTPITASPGSNTDVYFANDGAAHLTDGSLGGSFDIRTLSFLSSTTGAVTIGGTGNTLSIEGGVMVGSGPTVGISVGASSGAVTLNMSSISLNGSQTWINNSANPLTVNSNISGGSGAALTLTGGSFVLGGPSNTYSGGTTIASGNVQLGNSTALGSGSLAVNGGTLDIYGSNVVAGAFSGNNSSAIITNNGSAAATLTAGGSTNATYAGVLNDGSSQLAFTKVGRGVLLLTNNNSYSGYTTISAGTLQINTGGALGSGNLVIGSGATLDLNGQSISNNVTSISGAGVGGGGAIINNNTSQGQINSTISGGAGNSFVVGGSGPLDLPTITETAAFTMTDINTSTVTLDGFTDNSFLGLTVNALGGTIILNKNIFSGSGHAANNVTLIAGTVQYGSGQADGPSFATGQINGTLTLNGGTVDLNGQTGQDTALQALASSNLSTGVITNSSGANATLTISPNATGSPVFYANIQDTHATNSSTGTVGVIYTPLSANGTGSVQTLAGTDTYSGGTTVNAGTLAFASPEAFPNFSPLTINGTALVNAANHGVAAKNNLFASSLSIAGTTGAWTGKLDLANNDLIVQNGSLATITNQVKQGFNNGAWNGSGGIRSTAAAADSTHLTALGVIPNTADGTSVLYSSFDGATSAATTDVLVKYTYYGDANLDGKVDGSDYSRIDAAFVADIGTPGSVTGWFNGDFNYDGVINGSDYTLIDNAFNTQGAQLSAELATPTAQIGGAVGSSAVPEPTTLGLLGIGAVGWLGRRRRLC